jgi:Fe2+ transport system protein FeoA
MVDKIFDLNIGDRAKIKEIHAGRELKHRMKSFGLYNGVEFEVKNFSIGKNNVELQVGNSLVALRRGEMEKIEIEKI